MLKMRTSNTPPPLLDNALNRYGYARGQAIAKAKRNAALAAFIAKGTPQARKPLAKAIAKAGQSTGLGDRLRRAVMPDVRKLDMPVMVKVK